MISEAEIRRKAGALGVDPMIVDLDYVLGVFLGEWYRVDEGKKIRFKGGTCLRKCYYHDHRFSKDMDFTAEFEFDNRDIETLLAEVIQRVQGTFNLNLLERDVRKRVIQDWQGGETLEFRLYYRGPLRRTGAPQAIQLHISTAGYEYLSPIKSDRKIIHPYSDRSLIEGVTVSCYTLQEILAEKLRAICGQRKFAISRDVFDIHKLMSEDQIQLEGVAELVRQKFDIKSMAIQEIDLDRIASRRDEFEQDWNRDLQHLMPSSEETTFEQAWKATIATVSRITSP
jgi:predicted nucleotidyltransferase component of viral defense system